MMKYRIIKKNVDDYFYPQYFVKYQRKGWRRKKVEVNQWKYFKEEYFDCDMLGGYSQGYETVCFRKLKYAKEYIDKEKAPASEVVWRDDN